MRWLGRLFARGRETPGALAPGATALGTCDVCNASLRWADGYVLSATQVVTAPAYWAFALTHQWSYTRRLDPHGDTIGTLVRTQAAQSTGWLLCQSCSDLFTFDRAVARDHARRRSSWPPGSGPAPLGPTALAAAAAWKQPHGAWPQGVEITRGRS